MAKARFYWNDDYAGLETPDFHFYFGYEVTEGGEWCFQAKKGDEILATIRHSKLGRLNSPDDCAEALMAGICKLVDEGRIVLKVAEQCPTQST